MTTKHARHQRIITLTNAAITEKYTWKEIREMARKYRISETTVTNYIDEVKAKLREYYQRPEYTARQREYYQRPEYTARQREYYQRPEIKEAQLDRDIPPGMGPKTPDLQSIIEMVDRDKNKKPCVCDNSHCYHGSNQCINCAGVIDRTDLT